MKMKIKRLLTVVLTVALVLGFGYFSWDRQLRASDADGTVTAAAQQEQAEQTLAPVEVIIPAEEPVVVAPVADEPVAEEPKAEEPVAEEPVAEEPVAEEPVAEEPVAEEPVVEEPVAEEPVAEEPVVEEPVAEEPVAEEPAAEDPVAEEPAAEEPVAEEPVAEEPVAEEPVAEETAAEEPAVQEPVVDKFANANITVWLNNEGDLYYGDRAMLYANVTGVEDGASYSIQWQTDYGDGWVNIPGATKQLYTFVLDSSNATLPYRAVLICHD